MTLQHDARKRVFDFLLAALLLGPAFLICLICAIIIFCEDRQMPLFSQTRVGRSNTYFKILKLRTMTMGTGHVPSHNVSATQITRTGSLLRRLKIDELPQIYNVLTGSMSFVGPRPCLPTQQELIEERAKQGVIALTPGITGPGQLARLDMSTPVELASVDAEYLKPWTLRNDLKLISRTIFGGGSGDAAKRST